MSATTARKLEAVLGTTEHTDQETSTVQVGQSPGTDEAGELDPQGPNLPAEFWEARPALAHIRQAAHSRGRSPDAVLGVVLARVAALVPPWVTLPPLVGTTATLDLAVALVAASGGGKSSSAGVAEELVPIDDDTVAEVPVGSGEGIVDAYLGWVTEEGEDGKKHRVRRQVHQAVIAMLDEGQALNELGGRRGATLLPTIRTAWSGGRLGQANADEARRRNLPPRTYRFALVAGFQPSTAIPLLQDSATGTPQRFVWLAARDPDAPPVGAEPDWPGPLPLRRSARQAGHLEVDPDVATTIKAADRARVRGEVTGDELDAHRDLSRLKVAALLAALEERRTVTNEDWHLAGQVLDSSDRVRATIQHEALRAAMRAEEAGTARAVRRAQVLDHDADQRALGVMARAIARHVHRKRCPEGCRRRCLTQATPGKYRAIVGIDEAIAEAESLQWIEATDDTFRPGPARPS